MKVSLNTIRQMIDFDLPPVDELVARINSQLGGVEEVIDLGTKYKDAKIVQVVSVMKHPDADKLSICLVDDGGVVDGLPRDEDNLIQVVCGAPNVQDNMWTVWLPPESVVPSTFGTDQEFKLGARELRGVMSQGMLAAGDELAINNDHDGIISINEHDLVSGKILKPGANFAEVFDLNDVVIDIENKMFTHRPDLFGQIGVAREISGIFGHTFKDPDWYYQLQENFDNQNDFTLKTFNECGDKVSRLMLVGMSGVTITPSPLWLQAKILALGGKPINNVVDITNYVMLMTAQPTHCYDYDKLADGTVGARMARDGETIKLLNGKTYKLSSDDIVIADAEKPIGLGGIMGGGDSEVSNDTKRIVLEVANFDMYTVRKMSMRHGIFTDALTRFNKGQSMLMNPYVGQYTMSLLDDLAGAVKSTDVLDDLKINDQDWRAKPEVIPMLSASDITKTFINKRLGLELSVSEISDILSNVGFECEVKDDETLGYWAPAWRMDIQDKEDIVEEVGRLYGFDKLPRELPKRSTIPAAKNPKRNVEQLVRESLARAGANEVLTYSFVHENTIKRAEQDVSQAFKLSNALSPDLQYYRLSVLPSLLDKVHGNIKAGYDEFMLFEIGKGHNKKYHLNDDESLPGEMEFIDAVYASSNEKSGAPFYKVRRVLDNLAKDLGFKLVYKTIDDALDFPVTSPFEQTRSALVETTDGIFIGMIGELKQSVIKNFKLPRYSAAMTLDETGVIKALQSKSSQYNPLSKYPSLTQDISLVVDNDTSYSSVLKSIWEVVNTNKDDQSSYLIEPISIYKSDHKSQDKTLTFRIKASNYERTLVESDVSKMLEKIAKEISNKHPVNAKY